MESVITRSFKIKARKPLDKSVIIGRKRSPPIKLLIQQVVNQYATINKSPPHLPATPPSLESPTCSNPAVSEAGTAT